MREASLTSDERQAREQDIKALAKQLKKYEGAVMAFTQAQEDAEKSLDRAIADDESVLRAKEQIAMARVCKESNILKSLEVRQQLEILKFELSTDRMVAMCGVQRTGDESEVGSSSSPQETSSSDQSDFRKGSLFANDEGLDRATRSALSTMGSEGSNITSPCPSDMKHDFQCPTNTSPEPVASTANRPRPEPKIRHGASSKVSPLGELEANVWEGSSVAPEVGSESSPAVASKP